MEIYSQKLSMWVSCGPTSFFRMSWEMEEGAFPTRLTKSFLQRPSNRNGRTIGSPATRHLFHTQNNLASVKRRIILENIYENNMKN